MCDTNKNEEDHYKSLLRHLRAEKRDVEISQQFSSLENNADRVNLAYELLGKFELFPALVEDFKDNTLATDYREKGNDQYKNKNIDNAIEYYTQSTAYAQDGSEELSLAFANRSAALFEKRFYKECLIDITRALEGNCPDKSKEKLLARQEKAAVLKSEQISQPYHQMIPKIPKKKLNKNIQCATDSVEIRNSESLGRHVVAVKNIEIGEVIAVEKSFCYILIKDYLTHCHECLKLCYNLIPCKNCTETFYCSKNCAQKAEVYHKWQCKILKTIKQLNSDKMKVLPMKIALFTRDLYEQIANSNLKKNKQYRSDSYWEIHDLIGNTEKRTVPDLFKRSVYAAILFHLIKAHTKFFKNKTYERVFQEVMLLHMQTAPCNFHSISEIKRNSNGIYESEDIGAGAFAFISMFNHSCNPNVVRLCSGNNIVLRAIRTIKAGEQCFDNYGYHYAVMSKEERQQNLREQYFFDCSCEACENNWPLYQQLQPLNEDVEIDYSDLKKLMNGDLQCAQEVLSIVLPEIKKLEQRNPNKNFAEKQEIIKQCYALLGNIKRSD